MFRKTTAALRRALADANDVRGRGHGTDRKRRRGKNKMAAGSDHGLKRIVWKSKFPLFVVRVKPCESLLVT